MRKFLPLLAPAMLLSACGTYNGGLDPIHQPVVSRASFALDLNTAGYELAPGEVRRLNGWLSSLNVGYGDKIALDDPAASGTVRDQVAAQTAKFGLLLAEDTPFTAGQLAPNTVRVVINRTTAAVPGCPDHSREYQPDYTASTSSNFGCATNANLAAMVARPEDLVRGQPGSGLTDPVTASKAVQALRTAAPTAGAGGSGSGGGGGGSTTTTSSVGGGSQ